MEKTLTLHNGKLANNALWRWYNDYKGTALAYDTVYTPSLQRSARVRARAEWNDPVAKHSYFVSNKIQKPESISLSANQNYIVSYSPVRPRTTSDSITSLLLEEQGAVVQYFDGLGRPTQTVAANQSYYFNDLVTGIKYDSFGRQDSTYLPATNHGTGAFVTNQPSLIKGFYTSGHNEVDGLPILIDNSKIASKTVYEPSPLNRITSTIDPAGDTISYTYGPNADSEVILWSVVGNNCTRTSTSSTYAANQLYMTQTTDPSRKIVQEYKDKLGQIVLKVAGSANTYYVYDDFGLLRYVLSPKASAIMTGAIYTPDSARVKGLCYYYEYDARKRMIKKQLPGADPVYMVYDARDRLVLTQDGKTRAEDPTKWLYTKYENNLNRPIETGRLITSINWGDLQTDFASFIDIPTLGYTPVEVLTQTTYDNYIRITPEPSVIPISKNANVKGMITQTRNKILDNTGSYVTTDFFYDDKYRVIQTVVSGSPITQTSTNKYDFVGKVVENEEQYSGFPAIHKYFSYDHARRLEKVEHQLDETLSNRVVLTQNDYNDLGQLMLKKLHSANNTSFAQDIDYQYDIRGWLKSINNLTDSTSRKLYAQQLAYKKNGNINNMTWKNTPIDNYGSIGTIIKQQYDFTYDGMNRLVNAAYSEKNSRGQAIVTKANFFDETPGYDLNGNITTLARQGNTLISGFNKGLIDNLTYVYNTNSNQINNITDAGVGAVHLKEFKNLGGTFAYDTNGNATTVPHKQSTITYNYLNLLFTGCYCRTKY